MGWYCESCNEFIDDEDLVKVPTTPRSREVQEEFYMACPFCGLCEDNLFQSYTCKGCNELFSEKDSSKLMPGYCKECQKTINLNHKYKYDLVKDEAEKLIKSHKDNNSLINGIYEIMIEASFDIQEVIDTFERRLKHIRSKYGI